MLLKVGIKKVLWLAAAAVLFSTAFHGLGLTGFAPWHVVYTDVMGFFDQLKVPGFPYISKQIEYPVLTGVFMQLMFYIGVGKAGYYFVSALFLGALVLISTYLLWDMLPPERRSRFWVYWVFAPSMLMFLVFNWDIIAIFFTIMAIYVHKKNHPFWAGVSVALGFASKFFPVLFVIPLLVATSGWRARLRATLGFVFAAAAVNLPFAILNYEGWYYFFGFNSARTSNLDSVWSVIRWLVGDMPVPVMNGISLAIFAIIFALLMYWARRASFEKLCALATLAFLLANKVFSPQYTLWLLPFFLLVTPPGKLWFYALEFANLITFFSVVRWFFIGNDLKYFYFAIPFILIRHAALVIYSVNILRTREVPAVSAMRQYAPRGF